MFIDSYLVKKSARADNIILSEQANNYLNIIDEKQGCRELLTLPEVAEPIVRKHLWKLICDTHRKVIIVENIKYQAVFNYIIEQELFKNIRSYDTFIFNYPMPMQLYNNLDFTSFREEVKQGNKLAIAAGGINE